MRPIREEDECETGGCRVVGQMDPSFFYNLSSGPLVVCMHAVIAYTQTDRLLVHRPYVTDQSVPCACVLVWRACALSTSVCVSFRDLQYQNVRGLSYKRFCLSQKLCFPCPPPNLAAEERPQHDTRVRRHCLKVSVDRYGYNVDPLTTPATDSRSV